MAALQTLFLHQSDGLKCADAAERTSVLGLFVITEGICEEPARQSAQLEASTWSGL